MRSRSAKSKEFRVRFIKGGPLGSKESGGTLEQELQRIEDGTSLKGFRVFRHRIHDRVQYAIDKAVGERIWIIFAVDQGSVGLGCWDRGGVAEVALERIVYFEINAIVHVGCMKSLKAL